MERTAQTGIQAADRETDGQAIRRVLLSSLWLEGFPRGRSLSLGTVPLRPGAYKESVFSRVCVCAGVRMGKSKRKADGAGPSKESPKKGARLEVPSVSELGALSMGGSGSGRAAFDDSINIGIMKYGIRGSVYSDTFDDVDLFVVQMASAASPSPLYQLKKQVELFGLLSPKAEEASPYPQKWEDMSTMFQAEYQFVGKKTEDCDGVGWARSRMGFYITGDVKEFLMYLDELMAWRAGYEDDHLEKLASKPKFVIHAGPDVALSFNAVDDELKCEFEVHEESPPNMSVFDLPPPTYPGRIVIMTFELVSSDKAHVIFSGNTKPFQAGFVNLKIKGQSHKKKAEDEYGEYFRVLRDVTLDAEDKSFEFLKDILGEKCLQASPVLVRMKETKEDTTQMKKLLAKLEECANVKVEAAV